MTSTRPFSFLAVIIFSFTVVFRDGLMDLAYSQTSWARSNTTRYIDSRCPAKLMPVQMKFRFPLPLARIALISDFCLEVKAVAAPGWSDKTLTKLVEAF